MESLEKGGHLTRTIELDHNNSILIEDLSQANMLFFKEYKAVCRNGLEIFN